MRSVIGAVIRLQIEQVRNQGHDADQIGKLLDPDTWKGSV